MRAGLPVSDRDRTVSEDVAARNLSLTTGGVSASSVVNQTDPHQTPSAPGQRRSDLAATGDPARGQHRRWRHRIDDFGNQNHGRHLAGVASGLGALRDDQVNTRSRVSPRVLRRAG